MNDFSYENQGNITYLVFRIDKDTQIDTMTIGMLTNNKIKGLASTIYTQIDETRFLKYNVSSKVPASQVLAGIINRKRLLGVFSGILEAMLSAEDYMIEPESILLDLDYVFTDVSTCDTVLICTPTFDNKHKQDLGMFFKQVMFSSKFDQTENCDYIADILNYLNSASTFNISDFYNVVKKAGAEKAPAQNVARPTPVQPPVKQEKPAVVPSVRPSVQPQVQTPIQTSAQPAVKPAAQQPVKPPVQKPVAEKGQPKHAAQKAANEKEEKMSLVYLLRHYTKENAEIYKEQNKKEASATKESPKTNAKPEKSKSEPKQVQPIFAVPGDKKQMTVEEFENYKKGNIQPTAAPKEPKAELPVIPNSSAADSMKANFGNTTVLSSDMRSGETVVLNAVTTKAEQRVFLIRNKNNEKILINKPVYRIGKEKSYVDYFIGDNSAISRSHANIVEREGTYFIVDTNSTNHTYVDGVMIQSNVETPIRSGSMIRLANEDFEFVIC